MNWVSEFQCATNDVMFYTDGGTNADIIDAIQAEQLARRVVCNQLRKGWDARRNMLHARYQTFLELASDGNDPMSGIYRERAWRIWRRMVQTLQLTNPWDTK